MASTLIQINVEDYNTWRDVFDDMASVRQNFGCIGERIWQDSRDPNQITILLDWDSLQSAQNHAQSVELRQAMQQAGVIPGSTVIHFLEDV